jgi:hypothetical protein
LYFGYAAQGGHRDLTKTQALAPQSAVQILFYLVITFMLLVQTRQLVMDTPEEIEKALLNLEKKEDEIRQVAKSLLEPGVASLHTIDLITIAVMNRSLSNIFGFTSMIRDKNFGTAAAIIRLHLDTQLRLSACWLYSKPEELALEILKGNRIDHLKAQDGRPMNDRYLVEKLAEKHPWVEEVYKQTSGYIHLSEKHLSMATKIKKGEPMTFASQISRYDEVSEELQTEAISCMQEITNIQLGLLKIWDFHKRNPEKVAKIQQIDLVTKMTLQNDFSQSGHLIAYVNEHVTEFQGYFQKIKNLLHEPANDINYNEAFQNFVNIFDSIPLMATKLDPGMAVVRARPNYDGEIFTKQSEISYHPDPDKIKPGRFNAPGDPIFYGALPVPDNDLNFSLTGCLESCKALISQTEPALLQDMTIGLWRLNEVLPVVNLCIDDQHLRTNIPLKIATAHYLHELKKYYSPEAYEFIHEFLSYFSELSRTNMPNDECYYILSALFAAIRYYYTQVMKVPFTGLIFPSSATEGVGLNIALVPNAVDYTMRLDKVGMHRFILNAAKDTYDSRPCCDLVNVIDGHFTITNYLA